MNKLLNILKNDPEPNLSKFFYDSVCIDIYFDSKCLFKCKHCFLWKKKDNLKKISRNKIQNFLQNIKNSLNKNIEIVIGGDGMIELEPNLIFLLQLCSKYKFRTILASNGYLINRNLLFRLHKSGLDSLSFSLDYITAEKHDKQRGVKNSFSHIISLIDFVNQHNIKLGIGINCVIMKSNIDEIIPLAKWCISKNIVINFQAISQPFNTSEEHNWFKQKKYQHLWPGNQKKVYKLLDDLINLKKQNFKIANSIKQFTAYKNYFKNPNKNIRKLCNTKRVGLNVYADGTIKRCVFKKEIGNLNNSKIDDLLNSKKHEDVNNIMTNCSDNCMHMLNCDYEDEK